MIKARSYSSVGCKDISGPRNCKRFVKRKMVRFHKLIRTFQNQESCMAFIQVANFRMNVKCFKKLDAANSKNNFLFDAKLRTSTINLTGDSSVSWQICRVVTIHKVKLTPSHMHLPCPYPQWPSR